MKVSGKYGKEVWEEKIKKQNEVGVISGTVGSMKGIKKNTKEWMQQIDSSIIPLIKTGGDVLDLGVGPLARFAIQFAKRGFKVTGLDISQTTLEYAKKHISRENLDINLIKGDITELEKIPGMFDFIYCLATFYHIPPHLTGISLMKINEKLKKGCRTLIEFGIFKKKTIKNYIGGVFYRTGHYLKRLFKKGFRINVSLFSKKEVREIIIKSGFKIERVLPGNLYLLKKI